MAQRKSPASNRPSGSGGKVGSRPAGKPGAKVSTSKSPSATKATAKSTPPRRPPAKGKSIVNQKQTPWGLIVTTIAIVLFAAAVVVVVVVTKSGDSSTSSSGGQKVDAADPYRQPELAAAAKIPGVTYRVEGQHNHISGNIKYDRTPPVGGNHSQYWADCSGTVYPKAIANENAVHMLEHGAVWITYNADKVKGAQLATLKKYVQGVDRMALSPFPNLKSAVSLQSWGYQLFVNSVSDPRIAQFISTLRYNQKTTPEPGASCSDPQFKNSPSTFGHPKDGP